MNELDKTAFKVGFMQELNKRVNAMLVDRMSDEQAKKLSELTLEGDAKKLYEYQKSQFSDIDSIIGKEFVVLKQEIIDSKDDLEDDPEEEPEFATISSQPLFDMASVKPPVSPPPATDK